LNEPVLCLVFSLLLYRIYYYFLLHQLTNICRFLL